MGSLPKIDRAKPIGDQKICVLSEEALDLFPDLKLNDHEREWCNWTPAELTEESLSRNRYAVDVFLKKLDCCEVVDALLSANPEPVKRGIKKLSTHITGVALDKYVFRQVHKIRSNPDLQKRIQPVMDDLIEAALDESRQYVNGAQPDVLDEHYRNFHMFSTTVGRLNPALSHLLHRDLSTILQPFKSELSPYLFLTSLRAVGYKPGGITEWDIEYVQPWLSDPGSQEGRARGINNAAYNARPEYGWNLLQMHPRNAMRFIQDNRKSILRSLVVEMHRKCCSDPAVNVAWLAARFLKLNLTLHVILGSHPYGQLPRDLVLRVLKIANTVGHKMRTRPESFPGKTEVKAIVGSLVPFLEKELLVTNIESLIWSSEPGPAGDLTM